ncbi:hypothetical protein ABIF65_003039 [Bradyrhizobium japonicum]
MAMAAISSVPPTTSQRIGPLRTKTCSKRRLPYFVIMSIVAVHTSGSLLDPRNIRWFTETMWRRS